MLYANEGPTAVYIGGVLIRPGEAREVDPSRIPPPPALPEPGPEPEPEPEPVPATADPPAAKSSRR